MGLVSQLTTRLNVPHEEGQHFEVRQLSWRQLKAARDARTKAVMADMKDYAEVSDLFKTIADDKQKELMERADKNPLEGYDQRSILLFGIVGWSYDAPVSAETIDELDQETADWAALAIFQLGKRTEEEEKNGLQPST